LGVKLDPIILAPGLLVEYRKEEIRFLKKERSSESLLQDPTGGRNLHRDVL
jgi:hypothetical protein